MLYVHVPALYHQYVKLLTGGHIFFRAHSLILIGCMHDPTCIIIFQLRDKVVVRCTCTLVYCFVDEFLSLERTWQ